MIGPKENSVASQDNYEADESFSSFSDNETFLPYSSFPQFSIDPDKITVLFSPTDFHQCLVDLYKSAERRIVLAALYIGTAPPEGQVIDAVAESCRIALLPSLKTTFPHNKLHRTNSELSERRSGSSTRSSSGIATSSSNSTTPSQENSQLVVDILMDSARGRRLDGGASSLTMLESVFDLKEIAEQQSSENYLFDCNNNTKTQFSLSPLSININLFHSPLLSGLLYRVLPSRVNEILGVFHTKVFLVDNTVILSGANLSGSYLTNRQDRYVIIKDTPLLADFLHLLIQLIQKFSFSAKLEHKDLLDRIPNQDIGSVWWGRNDHYVTLRNGRTVVLTFDKSIPDPIVAAQDFRMKFGQALSDFLAEHSPPLPETSSTTLHVSIQAGFCHPPIQQEQKLLSILLSAPDESSRVSLSRDSSREFGRWSLSPLTCPCRNSSNNDGSYLLLRLGSNSTCPSPSMISKVSTTFGITPWGNLPGRIVLASGYLNMADELLEQLTRATTNVEQKTKTNEASLEVFMAAPEANSFFQSRGLSKYIPMAYSYVGATQLLRLRDLWEKKQRQGVLAVQENYYRWEPFGTFARWLFGYGQIDDLHQGRPPIFWEYDRESWTFHSKGIWFYPKHQCSSNRHSDKYPTATIVGSSNFGLRSRIRDLDISFLIQTKDVRLQQQFHKEVELMRQNSREVSDVSMLVTRCPRWLRFLLRWAGFKSLL